MSASTIGLIIGFLIGVANSVVLLKLSAARPVLKVLALADLVLMPAIGWAIGAYVFEEAL